MATKNLPEHGLRDFEVLCLRMTIDSDTIAFYANKKKLDDHG